MLHVNLLWHGTSVYKSHLRGPITLTSHAVLFAMALSLPVFTTKVCRGWDLNTQPSACGANALTHCATAAVECDVQNIQSINKSVNKSIILPI